MNFDSVYSTKALNFIENVPIHITSDIEPTIFPQNFKYCTENILGPGAEETNLEYTLCSCKCQGTCLSKKCPCTFGNIPYTSEGILSEFALQPLSPPLFECGPACECLPDICCNDVVQQGITCQLCIFQTHLKGLGVRTEAPIPRGSFVCEYAGEVIGKKEAVRRVARLKPTDANYIIVVKEHLADGKCWETIVDPTFHGNVGRFLNHSCDPNLTMVPVRAGSLMPRLAFFAGRDIEPGDELSYDYSGSSFPQSPPAPIHVNSKPCHCKATNCKLFLPSDPLLL